MHVDQLSSNALFSDPSTPSDESSSSAYVPPPAPASLEQVNPELLTLIPLLETLSQSWVQESADGVTNYLIPFKYTEDEWKIFFDYYFSNHHFTPALWNYIGYPVFSWGGENHATLQGAFLKASLLWLSRQLHQYSILNSTLSNELGSKVEYRFDFKFHLKMLNQIFIHKKVSKHNLAEAYDFLKLQLNTHPTLKLTEGAIDIDSSPNVAPISANILLLMKLTQAVDNVTYSNDIGATGFTREFLLNYDVLLLYNFGWTSPHESAIKKYFELVPRVLNTVKVITGNDELGNMHTVNGTSENWLSFESAAGVNIADWKSQGNPFPSEVTAQDTLSYCGILQHELNHIVFGDYISKSTKLLARHNELITRAGENSKEYLRSIVFEYYGLDFFIKNPQEFFASISNMYFTNSLKTMEVGLVRFNNNYKEPINQFLFFAEVYSLGSEYTLFINLDINGNYSAVNVPLTRDSNGFINSIEFNGKKYQFTNDSSGNVISYLIMQ